jgi:hypothetical protein
MELLVPGLILVALMVYASTRIKRISKEAYEPERIETEQFVVEKADGFLNIVVPPKPLILDGYSKEFGQDNATDVRQARYSLVLRDGVDTGRAYREIATLGDIVSDTNAMIDDRRYRDIVVKFTADGIGYDEVYRICGNADGTFVFKVTMLENAAEELRNLATKMLESFQLK